MFMLTSYKNKIFNNNMYSEENEIVQVQRIMKKNRVGKCFGNDE